MTPPDTQIEKQQRRHRPVLYWLVGAIAVFVIGALVLVSTPVVPEDEADAPPEVEGG